MDNENADNIINEITSDMPEVQQHVIENEQVKQAEIKETNKHLVDNKGIPFDPQIHETESDGSPKLTLGGKLRRKRGKGATNVESYVLQKSQEQEKAKAVQSRRMAVAAATEMTQQLGKFVGGEAASFIKNDEYGVDERANIFHAYDAYFEAKNINDFPPGVALTLALGGYGIRVMATEPAKNRSKSVWYGIKSKIGGFFKPKKKEVKKNVKSDAHVDSGKNAKREDNTSKEHSGKLQTKGDTSSSA